MREGIRVRALGDVCDILDSKRKPITKRNRVPGPYPYYGATGVLDHVESYIFDEPLVLIGEDGAKWGAGERTAYAVEGKYWVNNHAHVIRPNRDLMLDAWVVYYLNAIDLAPFISGLTVPKLNQGRLREIPIPLPPLPEQKRIVSILDEAFAGIATAVANTEKNLANARELFESYLNSVFSRRGGGWTKCMLAEVCDFENGDRGKNYPNKSVLVACGRPFVNAGHLSEGKVCVDRMSYIPEDRYQLLGNGKFSPGDILFCLRGSLGKFGMVGPNVGNGAIASSLVIIRPKSHGDRATVRREFLLHYFRSNLCSEMIKRFSGGAAQPNLGARDLAKFEIHCPSIEEQQSISFRLDDYFEDTKRLDQVMRLKLTALGELKQSLLQKAFSGELIAAPQDEIETALA